ncbi:probable cardiolipin synthase (CMP-forming) isoform X2 [Plodia interpunctella]|uniref:probable cardiolipin synthase (CMP-forming) isoform X2 n=1 Tax=Plodia interpunctella TaxID=58824 RepID=UPI002367F575|nr:probable cardiolipin synthase (CMP-forming) isoform X2 [Plodia interpunctella]
MKFLSRCVFLRTITSRCANESSGSISNVNIRSFMAITTNRRLALRKPHVFASAVCVYSSDNKKHFFNLEKKTGALKDVLEYKKEQLKDTEHRIRLRGEEIVRDIKQQKEITGQKLREKKEHLIKDILETKAKVKERLEIVVELDGWIARNWEGQSSKMGSFLDPLADKVLIATLFVSLTWQNLIPLNLTLLIVGRDVALVASAFVIRYMSLPPPRTLSRYFDVTHATAQLAPTFISKVNTAIQLLLVGTTLASPVFGYADHPALHALCAVTAVSTVVSAVSYLVSKDTYKFLKKS